MGFVMRKRKAESTVEKEIRALGRLAREVEKNRNVDVRDALIIQARIRSARQALRWQHGQPLFKVPSTIYRNWAFPKKRDVLQR